MERGVDQPAVQVLLASLKSLCTWFLKNVRLKKRQKKILCHTES